MLVPRQRHHVTASQDEIEPLTEKPPSLAFLVSVVIVEIVSSHLAAEQRVVLTPIDDVGRRFDWCGNGTGNGNLSAPRPSRAAIA
jgi:hypothetical protein